MKPTTLQHRGVVTVQRVLFVSSTFLCLRISIAAELHQASALSRLAAAAAAAASAATAQPGALGLVWEGLLSVALYSRTLPGQETPTSSHSLLCTPHDSSRAGAVDRDGHRRTRPARLACRADQAQPHELNNHLRRTNRETEKESQPDTHTQRAFMCIRMERACRIRVKCCTGIAGQVTCATPTTAGAAAEMAKPAG